MNRNRNRAKRRSRGPRSYASMGANEVLKLGPDVMPTLRRSADSYRRRQLFSDVERVKLAGTPPPIQPGMPPEPAGVTTVTLPGPAVKNPHQHSARETGRRVAMGFRTSHSR